MLAALGIVRVAVVAVSVLSTVTGPSVHASAKTVIAPAKRIITVDGPLSDVLADLRRHFDGEIILTDEDMGAHTVTGTYDTANPAQAVQMIVAPLGGKVTEVTPWMLIVSFK